MLALDAVAMAEAAAKACVDESTIVLFLQARASPQALARHLQPAPAFAGTAQMLPLCSGPRPLHALQLVALQLVHCQFCNVFWLERSRRLRHSCGRSERRILPCLLR